MHNNTRTGLIYHFKLAHDIQILEKERKKGYTVIEGKTSITAYIYITQQIDTF